MIGIMYTGFNTVHAHRYVFINYTGKPINVQGSAAACLAANHDFNLTIPGNGAILLSIHLPYILQ
jgi:hypothetical protein